MSDRPWCETLPSCGYRLDTGTCSDCWCCSSWCVRWCWSSPPLVPTLLFGRPDTPGVAPPQPLVTLTGSAGPGRSALCQLTLG